MTYLIHGQIVDGNYLDVDGIYSEVDGKYTEAHNLINRSAFFN